MFKGTKRRSARQISQAVEGIGGYLNAFTSEEHTCFYAKARHDQFGRLFDVLTDMFLHSTFDPAEIDNILKNGAQKARAIATPVMDEVKRAVGFIA